MKQNKTFKIILALTCFLAFSVSASAVQNPPIPGIGVVVKKNPGGGASKATTGKDGSFNLELTKGSYLVSLNQEQLMKAGQEVVKASNPKSNYLFNGDGTQLVITDNENIIMSQLEGNMGTDLMLITVKQTTTLQGTLLWDDSVINQPQAKKGDRPGHVTIIKMKNGSAMKVAETEGGPIVGQIVKGGTNGGTHKVKRTGHVTLLRFSKPQIYIGGGITSPSTTTKEAGVVNGIDLNISIYKPIWVWETISLGLNIGGGYTSGNGDYALDNRYTVYQLQGQSAPPTVSEKGAGSPKQQGFKFEAGPQMNIHLGDVTVSPILNAAYLSISQKAFSVTETVQENTVDYPYVLLSQKATKTNGLGIIPKIRVAYNITPSIGIWVEGSYIMGPKIATESTRFVLDPNIPSDQYNLGHFQEGQYVTTKSETKYSGMGVSGGIVIGLSGGKKMGSVNHDPEENQPQGFYNLGEGNNIGPSDSCIFYFGSDGGELDFSDTGMINLHDVYFISVVPCDGSSFHHVTFPPLLNNSELQDVKIIIASKTKGGKLLSGTKIKISKELKISKQECEKLGFSKFIIEKGTYVYDKDGQVVLNAKVKRTGHVTLLK